LIEGLMSDANLLVDELAAGIGVFSQRGDRGRSTDRLKG
jgi:hypothetical protein